ncbi:acetyl-CoA synthetase-like protein [Hypoxylon trugodes]|uniref:acetyl-CoA synthetase-like protein n=1 Tax=Hypoxylon trugodes TaxID=326681 RepID=UPI00219FD0A8|nr:acetyl-CoA synthetase-like protein [Hypoxylon trugodes]KAI1387789.1 acetyl-CoA synthetase-like protein [Hypoxylon trugodes]
MGVKGRPNYGRRLLPAVLDELAQSDPNKVYAVIPKTADISDGFRDITMADFARAVNFMARWIEDRFGRSDRFETISYIGVPDLRGAVMFEAAVKSGYKILLPSPRNPPSVNLSLMNQTESTKLLHTSEVTPIVKPLQGLQPSIHFKVIPSFDEMINSTPEHYPYRKGFDEAKNDPILVLHSSGSTGLPKPVTMTHASFATLDNETNLPDVPGRTKRDTTIWNFDGEARVYSVFPYFHLGGFLTHNIYAVFMNAAPVLGPPHLVPDGALLKDMMRQQKLRAMFLVPAVIEQLLKEPNGIDFFKDLEFLAFAGAPSSDAVGNRLAHVVRLISPFGSTETFQIPELFLDREDWAWHEFNPHYKHEMRLYDPTEGTYELIIFADESNKDSCAIHHNLPGVTEYPTKDLFIQHPDPNKPRLFKYYGRRDDIIVLANGEKFNPLPLEAEVQGHPSLQGAMIVANGRTEASLIVEPINALDEAERAQLLEEIWPLIEKSNSLVPGQGRIPRGNVICSVPDKPFARTGKGTIVRKFIEQAYKDEIEELYLKAVSQTKTVTVNLKPTLKPVYELPVVVDFVRTLLAASFAHAPEISETEDFFHYGLDSVQTLEITSNLRRNLQEQTSRSVSWITPRTIFRNSTLDGLSRIVAAFLNEDKIPQQDSSLARARAVDETVARYVEALPEGRIPEGIETDTFNVAIIGSTGYLGSRLLLALLEEPLVARVYCLDRSSNAQQRQEAALRELNKNIDLSRLAYMKVELGKPNLGLSPDQYDLIVEEVDVVVYNSWRLDFDLAIHSFSPFLRATNDLVDISLLSKRNLHIVFISSISSVGNMGDNEAPEIPVEDPLAALNNGYAQSKQAAERILTAANRKNGTHVSIVRVCQVGGPSNASTGVWADQPWISALLKTSKTLNCIPQNVAPVDWVPVDTIAAMLRRFIFEQFSKDARVFNIYPSKPQPWGLLVDIARETMGIKDVVPMREWVKKLRAIADPTADDVAKMPALKLLDYYEAFGDGTGPMAVATSYGKSISWVDIPDLDRELLEKWLRGWNL